MPRHRTLAVALVPALVWLGSVGTSHALRVQPEQRFIGVVNGDHSNAVVYVVCPGPASPGQTGHPAGGQFVAVILVQGAGGSTGAAATSIVARFAEDSSVSVALRRYGVARSIPTTLLLPCSGTGSVTFSPTPATATSFGDTVKVAYENIAV